MVVLSIRNPMLPIFVVGNQFVESPQPSLAFPGALQYECCYEKRHTSGPQYPGLGKGGLKDENRRYKPHFT